MEYVSLFGLITSVILLLSITFYFYLACSSKGWNKINAKVNKVVINKISEQPIRYKLFIQYDYFVKNNRYYSETIGYFPKIIFSDKKEAQNFLNSLLIDKQNLNVFVHPLMFKFSVIVAGTHNKNIFIIGALFSIVGIIFFGYLYLI